MNLSISGDGGRTAGLAGDQLGDGLRSAKEEQTPELAEKRELGRRLEAVKPGLCWIHYGGPSGLLQLVFTLTHVCPLCGDGRCPQETSSSSPFYGP